ncbi:MAG TPA: UDP-N-acetylmuramate:L-alanyl-gamma-D-glutamyl-meso-diaminopimelate ligase [Steroidobacteraceae bacterium]|nr:UDP-N-acetylmuramate:L-alanyl-gamma-D-glutamyl-meso-diaminopimelate ligase [Steroidobacteraceae bacterium]
MHVHILGICGTFMGGIAAIAREAGHVVTGSDHNVYPPMSTQLETLGIRLTEGWDPAQLEPRPDVVIVGNALSRGNPVVEALLNRGLPYSSGPEWLASHVLQGRWVLAVAGTHGKTTTSGMLAWILEHAGLSPGFLIGGVPGNFSVSARLGAAPFFVVEADEYDTAFFDKRAKFVHYRPQTAILNNLEYDHADIYPDVASIRRMFHQLVRTVPGEGRLIVNAGDAELAAALALGCWTPIERFGRDAAADWQVRALSADWSEFEVRLRGKPQGAVRWPLIGAHNAENALAALLAARHAGVPLPAALAALGSFRNARRRMEVRGAVRGVTVYDDFAHHPTAIAATIEALRQRVGAARILAVLEPRSATMRMGVHRDTLAGSLAGADLIFLYEPADLGWDVRAAATALGERGRVIGDVDALAAAVAAEARSGDHVLVMSNGGFGGLHAKLLALLGQAP